MTFLDSYCNSLGLKVRDDVGLDQVAVSIEKSTDERELISLTRKALFG